MGMEYVEVSRLKRARQEIAEEVRGRRRPSEATRRG